MTARSTKFIIPCFLLVAALMISSSAGRNDRRAAAPGDSSGCNGCHNGGTGSVTGTLTGAPSVITPGTTYPLTLTAGDFGSGTRAGFQLTASSGASFPTNVGTFTPGADSRVNPLGRLVQLSPKLYSGGIASWTFDWTAPTENTYSEVTFFYSINSADGTGGTGNDVTFNGNSTNIPVPVTWESIAVNEVERESVITWTTAMEVNTSHFVVQKSLDGTRFYNLGEVGASFYSDTPVAYSFADQSQHDGKVYYRIMQIDLDGQYSYSEVVQFQQVGDPISIYPTIVESEIHVVGLESGTLQVFDMNGQIVLSRGLEKISSLESLQAGMYIISIIDGDGKRLISDQIIKM